MSHTPNLVREHRLWALGYERIAGLDEAGRGAWAGPVVAAAVILPPDVPHLADLLYLVRDSKLLTPAGRERCYTLVTTHALAYGVGAASAQEIDAIGIVAATRKAMALAIDALARAPDFLLLDALCLPDVDLPQEAMPNGDRDCLSIAAASIIAKVTRDRWMVALDALAPGYGLAQHKGYGTAAHQAALRVLGPTSWHRRSFAPIQMLDGGDHV